MRTLALFLTLTFLLTKAVSVQAADVHMDVFGNVDFTLRDQPVNDGAFALGTLGLLLTGTASPDVRGLVETVIRSEEDGEFELDMERLSVTYDYRDYLSISAGKLHSPIGYYNTAYHHGKFLETAATRPILFRYEDEAGILPAHSTGVFLGGVVAGPENWQWRYDAGIGNGRGPKPSQQEIVKDHNNWKALFLRLSAHTDSIPFTVGLSAMIDKTPPGPLDGLGAPAYGLVEGTAYLPGAETTHEQLYAAHAAYREAPWEILAELVTLRRFRETARTYRWSRGGYAQVGYGFGVFTPYARIEFIDAEEDAYLAQTATPLWARSQRLGIRVEPASSLALKIEGATDDLRGTRDNRALILQAAFTF